MEVKFSIDDGSLSLFLSALRMVLAGIVCSGVGSRMFNYSMICVWICWFLGDFIYMSITGAETGTELLLVDMATAVFLHFRHRSGKSKFAGSKMFDWLTQTVTGHEPVVESFTTKKGRQAQAAREKSDKTAKAKQVAAELRQEVQKQSAVERKPQADRSSDEPLPNSSEAETTPPQDEGSSPPASTEASREPSADKIMATNVFKNNDSVDKDDDSADENATSVADVNPNESADTAVNPSPSPSPPAVPVKPNISNDKTIEDAHSKASAENTISSVKSKKSDDGSNLAAITDHAINSPTSNQSPPPSACNTLNSNNSSNSIDSQMFHDLVGSLMRLIKKSDGPVDPHANIEFAKLLSLGPVRATRGFNILLDNRSKASDFQTFEWLLKEMDARKVEHNPATSGILVGYHGRRGNPDAAEKEMLRGSPNPSDPVLFTTIIDVFSKAGNLRRAEYWMHQYEKVEPQPSVILFNAILNACARCKSTTSAEYWFRRMREKQVQPDIQSYNILLVVFSKAGCAAKTHELAHQMARTGIKFDLVTYNTLLDVCAKNCDYQGAVAWYEKMLLDGINPDQVTFSCIINACALTRRVTEAEQWFQAMSVLGLPVNIVCLNALMKATVACNVPIDLDSWLNRLKQHNLKPNEQFFTTIATPFARNGDIPKVERIIGMLRDEGLKVNSYSYGALLQCYSNAKPIEKTKALRIFMDRPHELARVGVIRWSMIKIFGQNEFKDICTRAGVKDNFQQGNGNSSRGNGNGNSSRGFHHNNNGQNNYGHGNGRYNQNQNNGHQYQRKQFSENSDISWTSR